MVTYTGVKMWNSKKDLQMRFLLISEVQKKPEKDCIFKEKGSGQEHYWRVVSG